MLRRPFPSERVRRWLPAAGVVFLYLYAFPYFGALKSANELPRVLQTQEIVDRGTLRIDRRVHELGSRFDVSRTPDGHVYPNKAPGPSLLAVPVYAILKLLGVTSIAACTWAFRVFAVTIPTLLFLWFWWRLARRFAPPDAPDRPRRAAFLAYAVGSLALPYGVLFFSHQDAAAAAGGAFVAAVTLTRGEARRPDLTAGAAGLLAGIAVLMDYQAVFAALAIGVYVLVRAPRRFRHAALFGLGAVPPAIALAAYHQACFGSPFRTGYTYAADPANHVGFMGIIGPNREALWNVLLAPSNGLLALMPWVVLAAVGGVAIARDRALRAAVGAEAVVAGVVLLLYVLFVGSLAPEFGRGGWSVGPRYLAVALPFGAWLATAGIAAADRHPVARVGAHALVLYSVAVFAVATITYPHWPEYLRNPLHELSLRLLASGRAVHSLGTAIGLRGILSAVPYFAVILALAAALLGVRPPARLATTAAALALAMSLVYATRFLPRSGPRGAQAWKFVTSTWEPR